MISKFDIQKFKEKLGLGRIGYQQEDYSTIDPKAWYYVIGDGGMKGNDVIARHIAMHRVITWKEHKAQQIRNNEIIDKRKRNEEFTF